MTALRKCNNVTIIPLCKQWKLPLFRDLLFHFQEMPYLSEGYSEATVDEDAVRKLTEFGDDYGSAIGQPVRLLGPADGNNNKKDGSKSPKKGLKVFIFLLNHFSPAKFPIFFQHTTILRQHIYDI